MSYIALYREWRPTRFKDVVEQEHVVKALRYSVSTARIAHAYLFCGTRGTGKTTMAQILSRAVNCLDPHDGEPCNQCEICREILSGSSVDVLEIDAASNNSVDNVRSIRDEVIYTPTKAKRKVYIIDEVHMLSSGAFNALLKTLEEPPEHVIFILATTEPHKLPATILSRCQRFDFRRISQESIAGHLNKIAETDDLKLEASAAKLIARMSDGAMRDAISLLDQCISLGKKSIGYDDVLSVAGIVNDEFMAEFIECMLEKNVETILRNVSKLVADGRDSAHFVSDLVLYFRNLLICKSTDGKCDDLIEVPTEVLQSMKKQAGKISLEEIMHQIRELSALENNLKYAANPRVLLEVTLIKLCGSSGNAGASLEERLSAIESMLESGNYSAVSGASRQSSAVKQPRDIADPNTADNHSTTQYVTQDGQDDNSETPFPAAEKTADVSMNSVIGSKVGTDAAGQKKPAEKAAEYSRWPDIMNYLRSMGRMAIHSFLLNVKAVLLSNDTIGLVTKDNNIRTTISKTEHIKIIEESAMKVTGQEMKIKCLDEDILIKASAPEKPSESSDLLKRARIIADKAGLPLEIIDE